MRCLILFVFVSWLCPSMYAQQKVLDQAIGWKGNHIELHSFSDKSRQHTCTVVLNKDSLRAFLFDSAMRPLRQYALPRQPDDKLLGGFMKADNLYLYLENETDSGLHTWMLETAREGTPAEFIVPLDLQRQKVLDRISAGDHFLYFLINKKASEFVIYDFHDESHFDTLRYHFEGRVWKELSSSDGLFTRQVDVSKVDLEGECSVDIAKTQSKIYLVHDTLQLLINREKGLTKIYSFDLAHKQVSYREIRHGFDPAWNSNPNATYVDNSFLLGDKLYYVCATYDTLGIRIHDFASGNLLQEFKTGRKDEISYKNTPIIQEGNSMGGSASRELDKTRQLLRKMANGDAVIVATRNSLGQVELSVGSFEKMQRSGSGFGSPIGMLGMGTGAWMVYVPTGFYSRGGWTKSARFKMLLDPATNAHINGEMEQNINEKIDGYSKDLPIPSGAENLFVNNGRYYYAYYDKTERKLEMIAF